MFYSIQSELFRVVVFREVGIAVEKRNAEHYKEDEDDNYLVYIRSESFIELTFFENVLLFLVHSIFAIFILKNDLVYQVLSPFLKNR